VISRWLPRGYVSQAREPGLGWREIGEALGLSRDARQREISVAEAAFDYAGRFPEGSGCAKGYVGHVT
jgi:hypothetical protein